ncbi:uncharacterized protein BT62DRAFT_998115 [Guyanagaster necrorhizus]|uniref:Uncharacterized protein n=1 Tax=Guyanagaster necrorhizus TaxID=856835 RepID=A0A9P8AMH1_9AGAR|nr:uncharacterized protein BT62DRAFT_998115 [Guyanagaster necrorhizus MCA 3950]KAG7439837.1 hypothetical protein BT62DRAFT_998115 [Guyanagaster necrorhizus MCA 3950]
MSTKIYIALNVSEFGTLKGKYHWALALPRPEFNYRLDKPLDLYQSVFSDETDSWVADHKVGSNALSVANIPGFMFLVQLPSINVSFDELSNFVQLEEPTQGSTPLCQERDEWSCASGSSARCKELWTKVLYHLPVHVIGWDWPDSEEQNRLSHARDDMYSIHSHHTLVMTPMSYINYAPEKVHRLLGYRGKEA